MDGLQQLSKQLQLSAARTLRKEVPARGGGTGKGQQRQEHWRTHGGSAPGAICGWGGRGELGWARERRRRVKRGGKRARRSATRRLRRQAAAHLMGLAAEAGAEA